MYSLKVDIAYKGSPTQTIEIYDIGPLFEIQKMDGAIYEQRYMVHMYDPTQIEFMPRREYFWAHDDASDLTILQYALIALDT